MKVAIWNSRGGLSSTNDRGKIAFANDLDADLVVISDYGKEAPSRKLLGVEFRYNNRILAYCRNGRFIDGAPCTNAALPTFLPLHYKNKNGQIINVLAAYAVTPLPSAHRAIGSALKLWSGWLHERPSIIAGDLNIWLHLKNKTDAKTSAAVFDLLKAAGYRSAFHVANGVHIGRERGDDQFTYSDYNGSTHIDFIFFSAEMSVLPATDRKSIKHRFRGEHKLADHSAVTATLSINPV